MTTHGFINDDEHEALKEYLTAFDLLLDEAFGTQPGERPSPDATLSAAMTYLQTSTGTSTGRRVFENEPPIEVPASLQGAIPQPLVLPE